MARHRSRSPGADCAGRQQADRVQSDSRTPANFRSLGIPRGSYKDDKPAEDCHFCKKKFEGHANPKVFISIGT